MRWKAMQFLGKLDQNETETYDFNRNKRPPVIEKLSEFESNLISMIKNIHFRPLRNSFLVKLKNDIKENNNTDELHVNADKTLMNFLKMNTETFMR